MYLYLSRHGIWYFRKICILSSGKRKEFKRSLGTRDKRLAKLSAAKYLAESTALGTEGLVSEALTRERIPPLIDCIEKYTKENSHLWQSRHRQRIIGILNQLPRVHLQKDDVSKLKQKWLETKSIRTVNKSFGYCSMFYKWLSKEYDGIVNRFDGIFLKGHKEKSRKPYSISELKLLVNLANELREQGRESHFWFLMIGRYTGMRANEICQLRKEDADLSANVFYVRGKQLKTRYSNRVVPIHHALINFGLKEFVNSRKERLMEHWKASERSYAAMPTKWYSNFRKKHKLPDFHSLRHTVASELKCAGTPVQFTASILGHSNGNITFDRYGHDVATEQLKKAIENIDRI